MGTEMDAGLVLPTAITSEPLSMENVMDIPWVAESAI